MVAALAKRTDIGDHRAKLGVMGLIAFPRPRSRDGGFTYADLEDFDEDDAFRYELSYGTLIVSPRPSTRHQALVLSVSSFLYRRKLPSQRVLPEAQLLLNPNQVKVPDVQVAHEHNVGEQCVVGIPDLVVEILSPATRGMDLGEKRLVYAEARIPAYWLVDPDTSILTVLELDGDVYVEVGFVDANGALDLSKPFTLTLSGPEIFD